MDGVVKINVDASWFYRAEVFSICMVIRNQNGILLKVELWLFQQYADVMEAESIDPKKALS